MNKFAPKKQFSFSYSKLKNFESCPRKHLEVDLLKHFKDESDALTEGMKLHEAARQAISFGKPLPAEFKVLQKWIDKIMIGEEHDDISIQTELKLAIDSDKKPCDWFSKKAWFRGVIDVLKIRNPVALIVDWKTGNPQDEIIQLGLNAQLIFSHYPKIMAAKVMYVWTKMDDSNEENLYRKDMDALWGELNPRLTVLKAAYDSNNYPPKKSGLCKKWCPVITCEHNGRG